MPIDKSNSKLNVLVPDYFRILLSFKQFKPTAQMNWMQHLRFGVRYRLAQSDPRCGASVRVIAAITAPALIARIFHHRKLGLVPEYVSKHKIVKFSHKIWRTFRSQRYG